MTPCAGHCGSVTVCTNFRLYYFWKEHFNPKKQIVWQPQNLYYTTEPSLSRWHLLTASHKTSAHAHAHTALIQPATWQRPLLLIVQAIWSCATKVHAYFKEYMHAWIEVLPKYWERKICVTHSKQCDNVDISQVSYSQAWEVRIRAQHNGARSTMD